MNDRETGFIGVHFCFVGLGINFLIGGLFSVGAVSLGALKDTLLFCEYTLGEALTIASGTLIEVLGIDGDGLTTTGPGTVSIGPGEGLGVRMGVGAGLGAVSGMLGAGFGATTGGLTGITVTGFLGEIKSLRIGNTGAGDTATGLEGFVSMTLTGCCFTTSFTCLFFSAGEVLLFSMIALTTCSATGLVLNIDESALSSDLGALGAGFENAGRPAP